MNRRSAVFAAGVLVCLALGAVAPTGAGATSVYVSNNSSDSMSVFGIGAGGALSPVSCDPATSCKTGSSPNAVVVDPTGSHLYTVNANSNSVSVFSIGADGALTPVSCDPNTSCKTGDLPEGMTLDPSGKHLYAANRSSFSVSVFAIGADGALTPVSCDPATSCKTGDAPSGMAVDPIGKHLYVDNYDGGIVSVFSIGADGALTPVSCDPNTSCKAGDHPWGLAVDPSGKHLYAANFSSFSVSVFAIGADGALTPVSCDPATSCKTGEGPVGIAVDPSGRHVYTTNLSADSVSVFAIGSDGALSPVSCDAATSCKTGDFPEGIAVDPSGSHVYVSNSNSNSVSVFSIGADGALSPVSCDPATSCKTGDGPQYFSLAITPDRGPVAALSASARPTGAESRFDAGASSSLGFPIASYAFGFGDGKSQSGAAPTAGHAYSKPGTYTVTVDVVDQTGCGPSLIFTGQTAHCNGSAKAHATQTITVPSLAVGSETISPKTFRARPNGPSVLAAKKKKPKKRTYGAKVTYTLNAPASVSFTVQRRSTGRRVKHKTKTSCDRKTKKNRKKKRCTRYVAVKGSFARTSIAGANTFRFTGRLKGKRLKPGRYRLTATPTTAGVTGTPATVSFKIIR